MKRVQQKFKKDTNRKLLNWYKTDFKRLVKITRQNTGSNLNPLTVGNKEFYQKGWIKEYQKEDPEGITYVTGRHITRCPENTSQVKNFFSKKKDKECDVFMITDRNSSD